MIDTLTIIASTTICLYILLRAVQLDRKLPWYPTNGPASSARTVWAPEWDAAAGEVTPAVPPDLPPPDALKPGLAQDGLAQDGLAEGGRRA